MRRPVLPGRPRLRPVELPESHGVPGLGSIRSGWHNPSQGSSGVSGGRFYDSRRIVMPTDTLAHIAVRVSDPDYDPRHAILDVTAELTAIEDRAASFPPHLAREFRELLAEIRSVQPQYPSRRETSPLFDRAGLGRIGRERAERLVRRLVALAAALRNAERG